MISKAESLQNWQGIYTSQVMNFGGSHTHTPSLNKEIWRAWLYLRCAFSCQILSWSVQHVAPASTETTNSTKFGIFGSSHISSPIGEIWHGKVKLWCALLCHISPGRVHHVTPAWLGTSNLTSFGIFEASDTNSHYQWGEFDMLQWTCDMLYMPNFILICALINASYHPCHVRNCKFEQLLNSGAP